MLTADPERLSDALGELDPTYRALLELSLHREVADPALAELLRTDTDMVAAQRAEALQRLSALLDSTPEEVESALVAYWRGEPEAEEAPAEEAPVPEDAAPEEPSEAEEETPEEEAPEEVAPTEAEEDRPEPKPVIVPGELAPRPRRGVWIAVTLLATIGLVLLLLLSGGGDDEGEPEGGGTPTQTEPAGDGGQAGGPEPLDLQAVGVARDAAGTARIVERDGRRILELRFGGLAEARHTAWLYNSIGDARALKSFRGPAPFVRAPLPEGYEGYRSLDVSREPEDGNPNHSGASVLRAPVADLPGP